MTVSAAALQAFRAALGPQGVSDDPDVLAPLLTDWRGVMTGRTPLLLRPSCTAEVAALVQIARAHHVPLVPQGGNTGLVQGGTPAEDGSEVLVSLQRMARIRALDADGFSMTAEAGVVLADVQTAAVAAGRMFPLSLGSEGSARIGGLVATNAGGVHVLRHGTMRALVLGLEAVLPDGQIFNDLAPLRKDNSGYDLKQLLIGSEGTLGIITAATLKLVPAPRARAVAWIGLESPANALRLLAHVRAASADQVSSFELMPRVGLDLVLQHIPGSRDPLPTPHPWAVLLETTCEQDVLTDALSHPSVADAVIAASQTQADALWRLRETLPEAERIDGRAAKHDIALPVGAVPAFLDAAAVAVEAILPGARVLAFGHLGDGNIHYNVRRPAAMGPARFVEHIPSLSAQVHDVVTRFGGSISAEHGIGRLKRAELARLADPAKLSAMRAIKAALDPLGLFNPGRIL
jgi:FAD/FMN-containing dehydrogenase